MTRIEYAGTATGTIYIAVSASDGIAEECSPDETWSRRELSAPQVLTTSTGLWCMACVWGRPRSHCSGPAADSGCMTCPANVHSLSSFSQHPKGVPSNLSSQSVWLQMPIKMLCTGSQKACDNGHPAFDRKQ